MIAFSIFIIFLPNAQGSRKIPVLRNIWSHGQLTFQFPGGIGQVSNVDFYHHGRPMDGSRRLVRKRLPRAIFRVYSRIYWETRQGVYKSSKKEFSEQPTFQGALQSNQADPSHTGQDAKNAITGQLLL